MLEPDNELNLMIRRTIGLWAVRRLLPRHRVEISEAQVQVYNRTWADRRPAEFDAAMLGDRYLRDGNERADDATCAELVRYGFMRRRTPVYEEI